MTWPQIVMWLVVAGIGVPAAAYNRTALALVLSWALAEVVWRVTEDPLPIFLYILCDYAVLLVIFIKPERVDCFPYRTLRDQIKALWIERHIGDRYVLMIFPLMWITYVAPVSDYYRWWTLWGLVIAQFVAAGWEAFITWRSKSKGTKAETPPGTLRWGFAGHG